MKLTTKPTILYVDDDEDDLQLFKQILRDVDDRFDVIEASNGVEGLKRLEEMKDSGNLPGLILLDINMPKMDGKQTLMNIRRNPKHKDIPITMFSTSSNPMDKAFAKKYRADYKTKPSQIHTMDEIVTAFVRVLQDFNAFPDFPAELHQSV